MPCIDAKFKRAAAAFSAAVLLLFACSLILAQTAFADETADFTAESRAELNEYVYSRFEEHIKSRPNETADSNGEPVTSFDFYVDVLNLPENEQFVIQDGKITNQADCFLPDRILENTSLNYKNDYEFLIMKDLGEKVSARATESGGVYTKFVLHFSFTVRWGESRAQSAAVDSYCDSVVSMYTTKSMTKYEKALALHDFMVREFDYATPAMMDNPEIHYPWFMIQGEKRGVCQAYTALYHKMLLKAGFSRDELRIIRHDSMGGGEKHTWNLIKLDGAWYHADVTWDDPVNLPSVSHDFFLKSDTTMKNNRHSWKNGVYPSAPADYVINTGSSDPSSSTVSSDPASSSVSSSGSSSGSPASSNAVSSQGPSSGTVSSGHNSSAADPKPPVSSDAGVPSSGDTSSFVSGAGSDITVTSAEPQPSQPLFPSSSDPGVEISDILAYSLIPAAAVILTAVLIIYAVSAGRRGK